MSNRNKPLHDHLTVCGVDSLAVRLVGDLRRLGEEVVVVVGAAPAQRLRALSGTGASIVRGSYRDPETLRRAGVESASAIALLEQDDVGNLHAGLAAQELNPRIRIVARIFNDSLRGSVETMLRDCTALSASSIAAPLFVAAALGEDETRHIEIAGNKLVIETITANTPRDQILVALSHQIEDGSQTLLPRHCVETGVVLRLAGDAPPRAVVPERQSSLHQLLLSFLELARTTSTALTTLADRRFRWLLAGILLLVTLSVVVFTLFAGLSPIDALYFTITTISTTGYGDITVLNRPIGIKVYGITLIVVGATLLALLYAVLIDALIGFRLARALGGVRRYMEGHIVVCGLGNVGLKVVHHLIRRGVSVVVVERDEHSPNLQVAKRLGIPVVVADASREESLRTAQIERARCMIAVTNDDITNLETGLHARNLHPKVPVVLRLFDHDLAVRVNRVFSLSLSHSVSALAVPAFTAALLGRQVVSIIPLGHDVLLLAEIGVDSTSCLAQVSTTSVDCLDGVRVVAVRQSPDEIVWKPADLMLREGDILVVVATRAGLGRVAGRYVPGMT